MDAKNLGIEVVYQDLALINFLNVYQNLFLGREIHKRWGPLPVLDRQGNGAAVGGQAGAAWGSG